MVRWICQVMDWVCNIDFRKKCSAKYSAAFYDLSFASTASISGMVLVFRMFNEQTNAQEWFYETLC